RLDVPLRVACSADAKCVILVADQGDKLGSVPKASLHRGKGLLADGRISSKRKDVLDSRLEQSIDDLVELVSRVANAGEVRHRLDAGRLLDLGHQLERPVARASAGAVGDRDESGLQPSEVLERLA